MESCCRSALCPPCPLWLIPGAADDRDEIRRHVGGGRGRDRSRGADRAPAACPETRWWWSAPWRRSPTSLVAMGRAAGTGDREKRLAAFARAARAPLQRGRASCWEPAVFGRNSTPNWKRTSMPSTSCCAASLPSANSRRAPRTTLLSFGERLSSKMVTAALSRARAQRACWWTRASASSPTPTTPRPFPSWTRRMTTCAPG